MYTHQEKENSFTHKNLSTNKLPHDKPQKSLKKRQQKTAMFGEKYIFQKQSNILHTFYLIAKTST